MSNIVILTIYEHTRCCDMSMTSHFETLTPGMKAKLNPGHRILRSNKNADSLKMMGELFQINHDMKLPLTMARKVNGNLYSIGL